MLIKGYYSTDYSFPTTTAIPGVESSSFSVIENRIKRMDKNCMTPSF